MSMAARAPAMVGMRAGQWIRQRLSERVFRQVFFAVLPGLGTCIVVTSLASAG